VAVDLLREEDEDFDFDPPLEPLLD
jgi:hypothetical protein